MLTELPGNDQADAIIKDLGGVHPEVGIDDDHVPRVHVCLYLAMAAASTLWWRFEEPSLGSCHLGLPGRKVQVMVQVKVV